MPTQITVRAVTKSYGGRIVLDSVTCSLAAGERTGIVGENGSGKTTLLRLLAGRERPDRGEVVLHAEGGVGHLVQDEQLPARLTVQDVLDRALGELRSIEERLRRLEAAMAGGDESPLTEYGELLTVYELRGGYDADARLERALHGLGLGRLRRDRPVGGLSGGEQARLRLAAVLTAAPEVLLLDEPTNHLDDDALAWLEDHLRARRGTTVAVSHDRLFLEHVTTTLLEVDADRRAVVRHGDGYSGYLAEKAAARQRWAQAHARWRADVDRLRETAATTARRVAPGRAMRDGNKMAYDRAAGRVQQSVAGRVRNAEERLRRLLAAPVPPPPEPLRFTAAPRTGRSRGEPPSPELPARELLAREFPAREFPARNAPRDAVLDADGVAVTGRLGRTALSLAPGERLLITGPNGAGKSTLLRVLAGELPPDTGRVTRHGRIGHLPQEPAPGRPGETLLDAFARGRPGTADEHAERLLCLGLFTPDRLPVPVVNLSTGQRQRLALARLVTEPADVLLLDEPTNHLSPALVEELEAALAGFDGALVVVSHDRLLRRRWRGRHLELRAARTPAAVN
ncbi:ATP-binding cassette domain-containing protein [Streptomyces sp. S1A]|uniref:ABC-F family ATP-binding cassette domain-containing protein n=1 Tax=Streptomyces sp. ICN903 TaxID=2964654 RepID=UPI001EDB0F1D|nr:ABC-F family ATP-binding cassette domain-containing protein [Streptomyces sp. ICN903]MCG3041062.1 ATP-binding cassette domain-containing protein [Streptomyces sp. ICN903]